MSIRHAVLIFFVALAGSAAGGCGGSSNPTGPSGNSASSSVRIIVITADHGSFSFVPANEVVRVGQRVAWKNEDSTTHSLVDKYGQGLLVTGDIPPGATTPSIAYSTSQTIQYYDVVHTDMKGTLSINP
jgi:plastocyanin